MSENGARRRPRVLSPEAKAHLLGGDLAGDYRLFAFQVGVRVSRRAQLGLPA